MTKILKKTKAKTLALFGIASTASINASAAIPAEVTDAITDLITDAASFVASFWALLIPVTIGFLWMKLFKKGTSKAT